MTGTYVGIADARAVIAQLVQTPDGKVTGRYEEFDLSPDGKLLDVNAAISGAASDDTIAVTFTPSGFAAEPLAISGTIQADLLHLTGGSARIHLNVTLQKSDETKFQAKITQLTQEAQFKLKEQEQYDQSSKIQGLANDIIAFNNRSDDISNKVSDIQTKMTKFADVMQKQLLHQRSIQENDSALPEREQINAQIYQEDSDAYQLNVNASVLIDEVTRTSKSIIEQATAYHSLCATLDGITVNNNDNSAVGALQSSCMGFLTVYDHFQKKMPGLTAFIANYHAAMISQTDIRNAIKKASNKAE